MSDLISRQAAIDALADYLSKTTYTSAISFLNTGALILARVPSAEPERKTGRWIPYEYGDERWHQCTACGVADKYIDYVKGHDGKTGKLVSVRNYCPNCGARMERDDRD